MKNLVSFFFILLNLYSVAQNCDSLIIIHHTYNEDGDVTDNGFETDSVRNGVVVNKSLGGVVFEYLNYDSLLRLTSVVNLNTNDSTVYNYNSLPQLYFTDYYADFGSGWVYKNDTSRSASFYSVSGKDSLFVRYRWNGSALIPYFQRVYYYNSGDTLFKWEVQSDTGSGFFVDSTFNVYYNQVATGVFRVDTGYATIDSSGNTLANFYDSLERIIRTEIIYGGWFATSSITYQYNCNQLSNSYSTCNGCHSGSYYYSVFDSLCRVNTHSHGHSSMSSAYHWQDDYFYVDCNHMSTIVSSDSSICQDDSTTLQAQFFGGIPPYQVHWSPAAGLASSTSLVTRASPDTTTKYIITIIDSAGLTIRDTIQVNVTNPPYVNLHIQSIDTISPCQSAILATDSVYGFHYLWLKNGVSQGYYSKLPIVYNGTYIVIVFSGNACPEVSDTIQFNYFTHPSPTITLTRGCNQIIASTSSPCQIKWYKNGVLIPGVSGDTLNVIANDSYSAIAIDSLGCQSSSAAIGYYQNNYSLTHHYACTGSCNGMLSVNPTSFNQISWSTGATASYSINNLCAGIYSATVTDYYGCNFLLQDTIKYALPIHEFIISTGTSGPSVCDGLAIVVDSLNSPYSMNVQWQNGIGNILRDSLCSGWNYLTITPSSTGCPQLDSVFINSYHSIDTCSVIFNANNPCPGTSNGSILVSASTGSPYACIWQDSLYYNIYNRIRNYLDTGTYVCVIIDSNGCIDTGNVTLIVPPVMSATYSVFQSVCDDSCMISLNVTGGEQPYNYMWCNGSSMPFLNNCIASCSVTIRDKNSCQVVNLNTSQPSVNPIVLNFTSQPASCSTCSNGAVIINAHGGVQPLTYSFDSVAGQNDTIVNVLPGTHSVCAIGVDSCMLCKLIYVSFSTGVEKSDEDNSVTISPNPMTDHTFIRVNKPAKKVTYIISDYTGRQILTGRILGSEHSIDDNALTPGVYLFSIIIDDIPVNRIVIVGK